MTIMLPNYQITNSIYDGNNSTVFRATRLADGQPVILKLLKSKDYPSPMELAHFRQEFEILTSLKLTGVITAYDLFTYHNSLILVLEDFGGESLSNLAKQGHFSLAELLQIFIQLADSIGEIHSAELIHKDINPNNIVYNPTTGHVKLIDFGIASRLPREMPILKNPNQLEGTIAYLSPEQTGRMNRSLDYRTDLYSFGVTCYELLTQQLPFISDDPLEIVHSHIAKRPVPVNEINPQIPPIIADIVMKLMAKTVEERYQSASGVKHDWQQCLNHVDELTEFHLALAQQDISGKFHLPQKLYGREDVMVLLLSAFEYVTTGNSELLLVTGYSGIGKSALVQEIHKPITGKRGYFIAGKFDQLQRNIPYFAVIQALRELMLQLLTETPSELERWRQAILNAVGNNGQIIIDVLAEVELIIGEQPALPKLLPIESQNRFHIVFQNFLKIFCRAEHPLVIFLDDLQWIDSGSLKLLTLMMSDIPYLLLIGAYRDNEVTATHPLMATLDEVRKRGNLVQTLTLAPLTVIQLNQLVSDTLHLPLAQTLPLAELVLEKTGGNPFFLGEFLKTLYVEHLLEFNLLQREWQWDLTRIRACHITANVVELMAEKIQRLSVVTQQVLMFAAAIGNQFDLATLAIVSQTTVEVVNNQLWEALKEGLVVPLEGKYKFIHDRVQQAAYSLIPETEGPTLHWQIGQLLFHSSQHLEEQHNLSNCWFAMVDHLNIGKASANTPSAPMQLVSLNLQACQKAKVAAAYQVAAEYLNHGMSWLTPAHWQTAYELTLACHLELIEIMYLCGNFERLEAVAEIIFQQAQSILDKVKVYKIRVQLYASQTQFAKAIQIGRDGLAQFGVVFPAQPSKADIAAALADTASRWQNQAIGDLLNLPSMTSAHQLAIMQLLFTIMPSSYLGMPTLFPLLASKAINLSIDYGHTEQSPLAYASYAVILSSTMAIEAGYQFGQLALQMLERLTTQVDCAKVLYVFHALINPWKNHLSIPCQSLTTVYSLSKDEGNLEYAGYAAAIHCIFAYWSGQPLLELEPRQAFYLQELKLLKLSSAVSYITVYQQIIASLLQTIPPSELTNQLMLESSTLLQTLQQANNKIGFFHFYCSRLQLFYLLQMPNPVLKETAISARKFISDLPGSVAVAFCYFYDSLAQLATYSDAEATTEIFAQVTANQEKMQRWAQHAPLNFQHKYNLVEAEKARILGHHWEAMQLYEQAILGAQENKYLQEEALAYELAGQFYLAQGFQLVAQNYLQEASYRYQRWGAIAKVKQLQAKYPHWLTVKPRQLRSENFATIMSSMTSTSTSGLELDLNSIIKASQALSKEIVLPRLLEKMMHIVIENAGAERGFFLLPKGNQWFIEAEGTVGQTTTAVLQSIPIDDNRLVSIAIIRYILRTQQPLVLDHAMKLGHFTQDPHVVMSQVKSVLGVPLKHQGQLIGILYLENNLTVSAFTPDRIEVLNLISSQLAISIENALLYANLEQKVAERTQELSQALKHLQETQAQLVEAEKMASLGSLVAGVAHEINTPVGIGVTAASMLVDETIKAAKAYDNKQLKGSALKTFFDMARQSSHLLLKNLQRVSELIQSFKQVAVDQTILEQRSFAVKPYLEDLLLSLMPHLKRSLHQVVIHGDDSLELYSYPGALSQIITNLVMNSLLHAFPKETAGILRLDLSKEGDWITIVYSDDGCGIPPQHLTKIFEPFFTTARMKGGTGLGLHIVYNLVTQKLQGTIRVESEVGKGVRFILVLPSRIN